MSSNPHSARIFILNFFMENFTVCTSTDLYSEPYLSNFDNAQHCHSYISVCTLPCLMIVYSSLFLTYFNLLKYTDLNLWFFFHVFFISSPLPILPFLVISRPLVPRQSVAIFFLPYIDLSPLDLHVDGIMYIVCTLLCLS